MRSIVVLFFVLVFTVPVSKLFAFDRMAGSELAVTPPGAVCQAGSYDCRSGLANLTDPDKAVRMQAYIELAYARVAHVLPEVEKAVLRETDPEVLTISLHTLHTLFLFTGSDSQQEEALRWFGESSTDNDQELLREYVHRTDINPVNRFQAEAILSKLQISRRMLAPVKKLYGKLGLIGIVMLVMLGFAGICRLTYK